MAERIETLKSKGSGRPTKYPWREWADGSAWRAKHGEDFTVSVSGFSSTLRGYADGHDLCVDIRRVTALGVVEFQFRKEGK